MLGSLTADHRHGARWHFHRSKHVRIWPATVRWIGNGCRDNGLATDACHSNFSGTAGDSPLSYAINYWSYTINSEQAVTQSQIARHVGVSRAAVSLVLSGKAAVQHRVAPDLQRRIEQAAIDLGYRPNLAAQQLKGKASHVIGVIAEDWFQSVQVRFFAWLNRSADERGYRLLTAQVQNRPEALASFVTDFASRRIDGLVYFAHGSHRHWPRAAEALAHADNVVCVMGGPAIAGARYVRSDVAAGTADAVRHLHERGRRRMVIALKSLEHPVEQARREGFLAAHRELGLTVDDSQIAMIGDAWGGGPDEVYEPCGELAAKFVNEHGADAVLLPEDLLATQVCRHFRKRGVRVPDDVAVVGHDNDEGGVLFDPPLTTISYRMRDVAEATVGMLVERAAGTTVRSEITVRMGLMIREST